MALDCRAGRRLRWYMDRRNCAGAARVAVGTPKGGGMGITIDLIDGRYQPCIRCDSCGGLIEGQGDVGCLLDRRGRPELPVYFVHGPPCPRELRQSIPVKGGERWAWDDLGVWFRYLLALTKPDLAGAESSSGRPRRPRGRNMRFVAG